MGRIVCIGPKTLLLSRLGSVSLAASHAVGPTNRASHLASQIGWHIYMHSLLLRSWKFPARSDGSFIAGKSCSGHFGCQDIHR